MELMDFYRAVLPAQGHYCLWQKSSRRHFWVNSLEELAAASERTNKLADMYFGTAAFDGVPRPDKAGVMGVRRTQESVQGKRCLYLDMDAGPEKLAKHGPDEVYATNADARSALAEFCKTVRIAPSIVVHSGAGLHTYFVLDEDATEAEWTALAKRLGALANHHGFKVDASCTTDSARVLRAPGALHGNGKRVKVLLSTGRSYGINELASLLRLPEVEEPADWALSTAPRRAKLNVNDGLPAWEPAPASALKAAQHCGALGEVATAQGDVTEPFWRAMIGIVKFSTEGVDLAHEWSRGHPDYDPEETEAKFEAYEGTGPSRCDNFARYSKACDTCPHKGKITTPLQLGRLTVQQVEALPEDKRPAPAPASTAPKDSPFKDIDFGEGYRVNKVADAWVMEARKIVESEDEDGGKVRDIVWQRFCDDVFWLEGWSESGAHEDDSAMVHLHHYVNSTQSHKSWAMNTKALATAQDVFKLLAGRAITRSSIDPGTSNTMHNYANSQFIRARGAASKTALRTRFGVQYDGDGPDAKLIWAHGRFVIRQGGHIEEAVLGSKLTGYRNALVIRPLPPSVTGRWAPEVWKTHIMPGAKTQVEFFKRHYQQPGMEVAQLAIMLSMASPLMVFAADTELTPGAQLPPNGLTVSLYSAESGQGKTALQRAVASAYGDPAHLVLSGSNQDATAVYQAAYAALLGTMPYFLDEVTQNDSQEVASLVNRIASGSDRRRANRDGSPRDVATWALIGSVSTNIPQREMLSAHQKSSDALQMRLIELTCQFPKREPTAHVQFEEDRNEMLAPNYGCLGAMLGLIVVKNGYRTMRSLVTQRFREAAEAIPGSTQRERFMQRGMACVLACHDMLTMAGLALFDRDVLKAQYATAVAAAVDFAATVHRNPVDMLRKMISDFSPQIIVTHADHAAAYIRDITRVEPVINRHQLRTPYVGRRVEQTKTLLLLADAMKLWCQENQYSFTEVIAHARNSGLLRRIDGHGTPAARSLKITRGTELSTVHGAAYCIDEARLFGEDAVDTRNVRTLPQRGVAPDDKEADHG